MQFEVQLLHVHVAQCGHALELLELRNEAQLLLLDEGDVIFRRRGVDARGVGLPRRLPRRLLAHERDALDPAVEEPLGRDGPQRPAPAHHGVHIGAERERRVVVEGLARRRGPDSRLVVGPREMLEEGPREAVGREELVDAVVGLDLVLGVGPGRQVRDHVVGYDVGRDLMFLHEGEEAGGVGRVVELVHGRAAEAVEHAGDGGHRLGRAVRLHAAHDVDAADLGGDILVGQLVVEGGTFGEEGHGPVEVDEDVLVAFEVQGGARHAIFTKDVSFLQLFAPKPPHF
mmetsp:Transcript_71879/g.191862  ORF Transcript_71879/g.191862 Transcript_71879/m.191862 type:complete len:286 (-) Transcript_71879:530-1387(-)